MDTVSEGFVVAILRADDDAMMRLHGAMEPDEILAIDGDDTAIYSARKAQHSIILYRLIGLPDIVSGEDIMAEFPEIFNDLGGEIFIGIKVCHFSRPLRFRL